jgi:hypothetical protein
VTPGNELKFGRATRHFAEVSDLLAAYRNPEPYSIRREQNPATGLSFWITLNRRPPDDVALAAGDCIHNLRSALDHIVYELSCHAVGQHVADTAFPILANPLRWKSISGQQLRAVPAAARKRIEELQPFQGLDARYWTRERLLQVHELDIADKHRNLNLAVANVPDIGVLYGHDGPQLKVINVFKGRLSEGIETLLLRFDPSVDLAAKVVPYTFVDVVFADEPVKDWEVKSALQNLVVGVAAVLSEMRSFF